MSNSKKLDEKHKDFFQNVFEVVQLVPKGRVTTYGAIAKFIGMPKSSRMVGWAMNKAHGKPQIPAHRVVNRIGVLTGKANFITPNSMENLLKGEGVEVINDKIIHFEQHFWDPQKEIDLEK